MLEILRFEVHQAYMHLAESGLVDHFRGSISGFDRKRGLVVIKPRGVEQGDLTPDDYLVISARNGQLVEGVGYPSTGFETHLLLYRELEEVSAVVTTHSRFATAWAQAARPIPCFGAAHADYFNGDISVAGGLSPEISPDELYEAIGESIIEKIDEDRIDSRAVPAILVERFGPYVWGPNPLAAARNAVFLEHLASLAYDTLALNPEAKPMNRDLANIHFELMQKRLSLMPSKVRIRRGGQAS